MVDVVEDWGVCNQPTTGRVDDEGERKAFPLILIEPNRVIPKPRDGEDVPQLVDTFYALDIPFDVAAQNTTRTG